MAKTTQVDIISGFLGAGKTTLIRHLLTQALSREKVVLIENEFGEIGIDSGFLQDAGVTVTEMNAGCICCSLVGDFGQALRQVIATYAPDRIVIEPSGVGKLSDVIAAVQDVARDTALVLHSAVAVVDATKAALYLRNFGEFYVNQVSAACAIFLSRLDKVTPVQLQSVVQSLRAHNAQGHIITTPWNVLSGDQLREAMTGAPLLAQSLLESLRADSHACTDPACTDPAHHHSHAGTCTCGAHHEHDHAHHEHDHAHHHAHGDACTCGAHHGHAAAAVFSSWGVETPRTYTQAELTCILNALGDATSYGTVLRAKGIVPTAQGTWLHFDYVPDQPDIRTGSASYTGRLCVIGADLLPAQLATLFGVTQEGTPC